MIVVSFCPEAHFQTRKVKPRQEMAVEVEEKEIRGQGNWNSWRRVPESKRPPRRRTPENYIGIPLSF